MNRIIQFIRDAFAADEHTDFTTLSIQRSIGLLAIPMIVEMGFEALFAVVDAFFVARFVGVTGVAVVGLTESVLTLIYSLAWGLSTAATALIARRIGEKKYQLAGLTIGQLFLLSGFLGLLLAVVGFVFSDTILRLMGGSEALISQGLWYTRISFLSSPVILLLFTLGGALRGAGFATQAMKAVIIANVINIGLDALFVGVLHWGVAGAAAATAIGRTFGVGIQLYYLFFGTQSIPIYRRHLTPIYRISKQIIQLAAGGAGQFIIQSASWVFLIRILSSYGDEIVAGYTIGIRIIVFTILPSWGLANAAATLVGQNLGANQPEKAMKSAIQAAWYNMGFLALVALFFFVFAPELVGLFDQNPAVLKTGVECLQILCLGYVFFGFGMVMSQALNGAGDTVTPTWINLICFWIIEIPLAYFLAKQTSLEETGVFYAIVISESILALLALYFFRRGKWKTQKL
ncbi:MAG: MATE family efflux transporter [Spirosomataceae bacterium]